MGSVDAANRFVNCVMNRYRSDTVMRMGAILLLIIAPFFALFFGYAYLGDSHDDVKNFLVWSCLAMFFFFISLAMFLIYRRLVDHSVRDREWRESLIEYAASKGGDVTNLWNMNHRANSGERSSAEVPAILLLVIFFLAVMFVCGNPNMFGINGTDPTSMTPILVIGVLVALFMMLFVFLYVLRFPFKHESLQIDFTIELCRILSGKGVNMIEMRQTINHKSVVLNVILFLITGGLWSIIMLYRAYSDANIHVQNQWSYENRAMELIIEAEHGVGVAQGKAGDVQ